MVGAVGLLIGAMFPAYLGSSSASSVVQTPYEMAVYICLEAGWALAAFAVLTGWSLRGGVALGAGLGAVEVGLVLTDVASGFQISNGSAPGVWLAVAGVAAGLAGVLYGAGSVPYERPAGASSTGSPVRALLAVLAAVVAVADFWPSWDHLHLVAISGQVENVNVGDAFSQPGAVMAGELLAGLAIGLAVVVAAFWRDAAIGAWGMGGVAIALASQVASGAVQVSEPVSQYLGAGAASAGANLSASSLSLTTYWYVDAVATAALFVLALWAAFEGRSKSPAGASADQGEAGAREGSARFGQLQGAGYSPGNGGYHGPSAGVPTAGQPTGAPGPSPAPPPGSEGAPSWPGAGSWPR